MDVVECPIEMTNVEDCEMHFRRLHKNGFCVRHQRSKIESCQ